MLTPFLGQSFWDSLVKSSALDRSNEKCLTTVTVGMLGAGQKNLFSEEKPVNTLW